MKTLLLSLISVSALATDLAPNAALSFDFPELPNTLAGRVSGTEKSARLAAILPRGVLETPVIVSRGSGIEC